MARPTSVRSPISTSIRAWPFLRGSGRPGARGFRIDPADGLAAAAQGAVGQPRAGHDALVAAADEIGDDRRGQRVFHHHTAAADVAHARRLDRLRSYAASIG